MSRSRVATLPHGATTGVDGVVRELQRQARIDRSYHDQERTVAKERGGAIDITIPATTAKAIRHGLGRRPQGWRLIDITAASDIAAQPYRTAWDADTITIRNGNVIAVTIRIEVF